MIDVGLSQLDAGASGRMGSRALLYYFTTTMIAVVIGIVCVLTIKPGVHSVKGELDEDKEKRIVKTVDAFLDLVRYFIRCAVLVLYLLWPTLYFCPVVSIFLLSSFFIPRLISAVGDWMSTILPHMVWP